jgi:hypothetical protein
VTDLKIPVDYGIAAPAGAGGKRLWVKSAGPGARCSKPDVVDISAGGRRLSAGIEQRLVSGFYDSDEALAVIADRLLGIFGI